MVGKGQETTLEIRNVVIFHWKNGKSCRQIGNIVNKSFTTVRNIINRFINEGKIENKTGRGRKKLLNLREERLVV